MLIKTNLILKNKTRNTVLEGVKNLPTEEQEKETPIRNQENWIRI